MPNFFAALGRSGALKDLTAQLRQRSVDMREEEQNKLLQQNKERSFALEEDRLALSQEMFEMQADENKRKQKQEEERLARQAELSRPVDAEASLSLLYPEREVVDYLLQTLDQTGKLTVDGKVKNEVIQAIAATDTQLGSSMKANIKRIQTEAAKRKADGVYQRLKEAEESGANPKKIADLEIEWRKKTAAYLSHDKQRADERSRTINTLNKSNRYTPRSIIDHVDSFGQKPLIPMEKEEVKKIPTQTAIDMLISGTMTDEEGMRRFNLDRAGAIKLNAEKDKGKGRTTTTTVQTDDGNTVTITQGPADSGLTKPTETELQKDLVALGDQRLKLDEIKDTYKREFLTYEGQMKGLALNKLSKSSTLQKVFDLTPEDQEFIGQARVFKEQVERIFNAYRKDITGAAAAFKEIIYLRDSILNSELSPDAFEASYKAYTESLDRVVALKKFYLEKGVKGKALGDAIDESFIAGQDAADLRGDEIQKELEAQGVPEAEIEKIVIEQLRKEGF